MTELSDRFAAAVAHRQAGRLTEAEDLCRRILGRAPNHPQVLHLLGSVLNQTGRREEAVDCLQRAVARQPAQAVYHFDLAAVYMALRRWNEAVAAYREVVALVPGDPNGWINLGSALKEQGDYHGALAAYTEVLRLRPNWGMAYYNLANLHLWAGHVHEARVNYERAVALEPESVAAYSNLLFALSYGVLASPQESLEAHVEWDHRFGGGEARRRTFRHERVGDPDKRLKVGYVSPDFKRHSVSYFFEPLLRAHDRRRVEVYCYAEVAEPDVVTERIKGETDHWRSTVGRSDEAVARQIYEDGIDILVDLAGHTTDSRLRVFTFKPAPVQATYLGYFATTGLRSIDYWISDDTLTPHDTVERSVEEIWRLPRCCLSYEPPEGVPEAVDRPSGAPIVFGSFNHVLKISDRAIALWSRVLRAVPNSRLFLKTGSLASVAARADLSTRFVAHGVEAGRLEMRGRTSGVAAHFATYGEVDIALDTVPRTGGTTTADALWMGVPVLSLAGERFIERLSATMLAAIGRSELIASSEDEYVAKAIELARDSRQRKTLRKVLRADMAASPLCNAPGLAASLESAYRVMWRRYLGI